MAEHEEQMILEFLDAYPDAFLSAGEIARKAAGRRHFEEDPRWAYRPLSNLVARGLLETDEGGHFRLKPRR